MLSFPYIANALGLLRKNFIGELDDQPIGQVCPVLSLIAFLLMVGKQTISSQGIQCIGEYHFSGNAYVKDYCYIHNTFVPSKETDVSFDRSKYMYVKYYPWLALYFIIKLLCIHFPVFFWRQCYKNSDIGIDLAVNLTSLKGLNGKGKSEALRQSSIPLVRTARERHNEIITDTGIFHGGRFNLLTWKYLLMKFLNMLIVVLIIGQVASFLDHTNFFWSFQTIQAFLRGRSWTDSRNFPRIVMCDVPVHTMGNWQNATAQCLLTMNYLSEKILVFEWAWFVIVFCVAAYQILSFSFKIKEKTRICKLQSWLNRPLRLKCTKAQAAYLSDLIGLDGFLTIYFIEVYNGDCAASDFSVYIYKELMPEMTAIKKKKFKKIIN